MAQELIRWWIAQNDSGGVGQSWFERCRTKAGMDGVVERRTSSFSQVNMGKLVLGLHFVCLRTPSEVFEGFPCRSLSLHNVVARGLDGPALHHPKGKACSRSSPWSQRGEVSERIQHCCRCSEPRPFRRPFLCLCPSRCQSTASPQQCRISPQRWRRQQRSVSEDV